MRGGRRWWAAALIALFPVGCGDSPSSNNNASPSSAPARPSGPAAEGRTLPAVNISKAPAPIQRMVQIVRNASAKGPFKADYAEELGALYLNHGFMPQAITCFTIVTETDPKSPFGWYDLAIAHEKNNDIPAAIAAFEKTVQVAPNYAPALIRLALLQQKDSPDKAAANYKRALTLNASLAVAHYGLGQIAAAAGHHEEAVQEFQTAIALTPNYESAHAGLAASLEALGRSEEAAKHKGVQGAAPLLDDQYYVKLMRWGLDPGMMVSDALQAAQQKKFDDAEKLLKDAVEIDSGITARIAFGGVRMMQNRPEEAAEQFRLALKQDPDSAEAKRNLGAVLVQMRQTTEAEQLFRELLAKNPSDYVSTVRLATLLAQLNRPDESIPLYVKATELSPNHPSLHLEFATALMSFSKLDEALVEVRKHLELKPNDALALQMMGTLLIATKDYKAANEALERSVAIQPRQLEAYRGLVEIALKENAPARAKAILTKALETMPKAAPLANLLAWILATTPDKEVANAQEAIDWAEKACRMAAYKSHEFLDTLAAASAAAGKFDDAVRWEKEAIRLATEAKQTASIESYQKRLALFESKQPYVEVTAP